MEGFHHSHFEKIIGGTEIERREAEQRLDIWNRKDEEKLLSFEVSLSDKDRALIKETESETENIVKRYGGNPKPFRDEQIHIVRPGSIISITGGRLKGGFHSPLADYIAVERGLSTTQFALSLAHELFHLKSPKVGRITSRNYVTLYRSGIKLVDRKDESGKNVQLPPIYFAELEEAIIAELTERLYRGKIAINPRFQDEMEVLGRVKAWIKRVFQKADRAGQERLDEVLKDIRTITPSGAAELLSVFESEKADEDYKIRYFGDNLQRLMEQGELRIAERYEERQKLHNLLDELVKRNSHDGSSSTKEGLFVEFARANFTGNYLALAHIVEDRMGKGAFRRLAENSKLGNSASSWL